MKENARFDMLKKCAFTGHRHSLEGLDYNLLDRVILNLMKSGVNRFYCGMAVGFDLAAAESVLQYKKEYGAELYACIPCESQPDGFSVGNRRRYLQILENCDGEIIFSPVYFDGCMQMRDRFLVDNCDVLVSFLRSERGGTRYTVTYAESKGVKIIEL